MSLEDDINRSNQYYLLHDLAVIHKKPTPIQVVRVDYPSRNKAKIIEAYYRHASTTDYNGVFNGSAIDFEAKETKNRTLFPLSSLHQHQIEHLKAVDRQKAIAFIIIRFTVLNETYLIFVKELFAYIRNEKHRSLPLKWIQEHGHLIDDNSYQIPCHYLKIVEEYQQRSQYE